MTCHCCPKDCVIYYQKYENHIVCLICELVNTMTIPKEKHCQFFLISFFFVLFLFTSNIYIWTFVYIYMWVFSITIYHFCYIYIYLILQIILFLYSCSYIFTFYCVIVSLVSYRKWFIALLYHDCKGCFGGQLFQH